MLGSCLNGSHTPRRCWILSCTCLGRYNTLCWCYWLSWLLGRKIISARREGKRRWHEVFVIFNLSSDALCTWEYWSNQTCRNSQAPSVDEKNYVEKCWWKFGTCNHACIVFLGLITHGSLFCSFLVESITHAKIPVKKPRMQSCFFL